MPEKTCGISGSVFEGGVWHVRADVEDGLDNCSATYTFEGEEDWTDAQLETEVLKLY